MTDILTIKVGKNLNNATFRVHKLLVCAHSIFFETMCQGPWLNRDTNLIELKQFEPDVFKMYCAWLYQGMIPEARWVEEVWLNLFKLYWLGGELIDTAIQNAIVNKIVEARGLLTFDLLLKLHEELEAESLIDSPLYRLHTELVVGEFGVKYFDRMNHGPELPEDVMIRVESALSSIAEEGEYWQPRYTQGLCQYHDHRYLD